MPGPERSSVDGNLPLVELLDRLIDKGVAVSGDVALTVADVELLRLRIDALLESSHQREADPAAAPAPGNLAPGAAASSNLASSNLASSAAAPSTIAPCGLDAPGGSAHNDRSHPRLPSGGHRVASDGLSSHRQNTGQPLPQHGDAAIRQRLDGHPDDVAKGLGHLVVGLVELLRELLERQALRRLERDELAAEQVERLGMAFLQLEQRMQQLRQWLGTDTVTADAPRTDRAAP